MKAPDRALQKKYGSRAMAVAIVVGLLLVAIGYKPLAKGLVLGSLFSVINFVIIGETLPARLGKSRRKTFLFALGSIFFRYALMAAPLIVAIKMEQVELATTVVGLFMIQLVILAEHLLAGFRRKHPKQV
jgi:hypothetical protein